ncbi:hypothetical protein [Limibacterium fermenti]|uniref:hypothetical protein n=1 Tax=Limibacterium fermenti TaxID=3229863 RepID=UPI000E9BD3C7|nr:hypothetical protein [Porphyromonadaceae bacterium]
MKESLSHEKVCFQKEYDGKKLDIEMVTNPFFKQLTDFVMALPGNASLPGKIIYSKRNDVSVMEIMGVRLTIKAYKHITLANKIIYATVRKSKAERAYNHALELTARGISTPAPIAYIDCYRHKMLQKSFFICLYVNYPSVSDFRALPIPETETLFRAFGHFTYHLHLKGVYHKDYSLSNVLVIRRSSDYDFCLIDNNRIHFGEYSLRESMKNMYRLSLPADKYAIVGSAYAEVSKTDDIWTVSLMFFYREFSIRLSSLKRKVKNLLKIIRK